MLAKVYRYRAPGMEGVKKSYCVICCTSFEGSVEVEGDEEESTSESEGEIPMGEENRNNGLRQGEDGGVQKYFKKFLGEVLGVENQFESLVKSVCPGCMTSVINIVPAMEESKALEEKVLELQKTLLENLKVMNGSLTVVNGELQNLDRSINNSDVGCLQSLVKRGDFTNEVFVFRDKIAKASHSYTTFKRNVKSKITAEVTTVGGGEDNDAQSKPGTSRRIRYLNADLFISVGSQPSKKKPSTIPKVDDKRVQKLTVSTPLAKRTLRSRAIRKQFSLKRKAPVIRSEMKKNTPLNKQSMIRGTKRRLEEPALVIKRTRTAARRQDFPAAKKNESGALKLPTAGPSSDPKRLNPVVRIIPLSSHEIAKHMRVATVNKQEISTQPSPPPDKKPVKRTIISFGSSEDSESSGEDEEEEEPEPCTSEPDSDTKFVRRSCLRPWKCKIITALLSKTKFLQRKQSENEDEKKVDRQYCFMFNRQTKELTYGRIVIEFYDEDGERVLGCRRCRGEWKTSHNEANFFDEITNHIRTKHLSRDAATSSGTGSSTYSKRKQQKEDWDPKWEDSDSDEEEEAAGPSNKNNKPPQRSKKQPAKFDKDSKKEDNGGENRSGENRSSSSSVKSLFEIIQPANAGCSLNVPKKDVLIIPALKQSAPAPMSKNIIQKSTTLGVRSVVFSKTKKVMGLFSKWNAGLEGQRCLELIKKNVLRSSPDATSTCTLNHITSEISVLGISISFDESSSSLKCSMCNRVKPINLADPTTTAHRDLILHILVDHTTTFQCPNCDVKSNSLMAYSNHLKTHPQNQVTDEEGNLMLCPNDQKENVNDFKTTGKITLNGRNNNVEEETSSDEEGEDELYDI